MILRQISLFLENKAGQITGPCRVLAGAGINILTMTLADTQQFGILRMIVSDWEKAKESLEAEGYVVNIAEVVALEVEDRPGGFLELQNAIEALGINIEYCYAFTYACGGKAVMIFRFEDAAGAIRGLRDRGINIVDEISLRARIEKG